MKNVTIYTTPTCQYCKMTKEFFAEHDVQYTEKDVANDQDAAREMMNKSNQLGVPVIVISPAEGGEEELIVGFDQNRLSSALDIQA